MTFKIETENVEWSNYSNFLMGQSFSIYQFDNINQFLFENREW